MSSCSTSHSGARLSLSMRRYSSCRAAPRVGWGTLAMANSERKILRSGDRPEPDHRLAERRAERLALGVGERGLARFADRRRLRTRVGGVRVFHQRIDDGEEVRLAAPMRLAVTLDETGALGDLEGETGIAPCRLGDQAQPALDQLLLLAVPVAARPPRLHPGERAHHQVAEEARGLDVHADVVGIELAAALRPRNESFAEETRKNGCEFFDSRLQVIDDYDRLAVLRAHLAAHALEAAGARLEIGDADDVLVGHPAREMPRHGAFAS